jgi:hypothetical protein
MTFNAATVSDDGSVLRMSLEEFGEMCWMPQSICVDDPPEQRTSEDRRGTQSAKVTVTFGLVARKGETSCPWNPAQSTLLYEQTRRLSRIDCLPGRQGAAVDIGHSQPWGPGKDCSAPGLNPAALCERPRTRVKAPRQSLRSVLPHVPNSEGAILQ